MAPRRCQTTYTGHLPGQRNSIPKFFCLNGFATISWQRRTPRLRLANMCSQTRRLQEQAQTLTHACARFALQGSDQPHEHPHPTHPDHPWPPRPHTTNTFGEPPLFIPGGCKTIRPGILNNSGNKLFLLFQSPYSFSPRFLGPPGKHLHLRP